MDILSNIAGSKLEIISGLLSIEDEEILKRILFIIHKAKKLEEKEISTSNNIALQSMNKTQFLKWLRDCEEGEMMTKDEFTNEFEKWKMKTSA